MKEIERDSYPLPLPPIFRWESKQSDCGYKVKTVLIRHLKNYTCTVNMQPTPYIPSACRMVEPSTVILAAATEKCMSKIPQTSLLSPTSSLGSVNNTLGCLKVWGWIWLYFKYGYWPFMLHSDKELICFAHVLRLCVRLNLKVMD